MISLSTSRTTDVSCFFFFGSFNYNVLYGSQYTILLKVIGVNSNKATSHSISQESTEPFLENYRVFGDKCDKFQEAFYISKATKKFSSAIGPTTNMNAPLKNS